jgi:hypothetical protein
MAHGQTVRAAGAFFFFFCLATGCGGGDGTHRLSGKVTFKGEPIATGKIYFLPDTTKGNTGPGGYADITDGRYDTDALGGRRAVAGAAKVAIEAWEPLPKADKDSDVTTKVLFPRYETTADLPAGGTKDFDVPAAAANKKAPPKGVVDGP